MKKHELLNGMLIKVRTGETCIYLDNYLVFSPEHSVHIKEYNEQLYHRNNYYIDITEIGILVKQKNGYYNQILWKREPEIDWSKIEPGTKVIVSDNEDFENSSKGVFIGFYENKFYAKGITDVVMDWQYCKLMEEE